MLPSNNNGSFLLYLLSISSMASVLIPGQKLFFSLSYLELNNTKTPLGWFPIQVVLSFVYGDGHACVCVCVSLLLVTLKNVYKTVDVWVHSKEAVNNVNVYVNNKYKNYNNYNNVSK